MKKNYLPKLLCYAFLFWLSASLNGLYAQSGCPDCITTVPGTLAADTLYLSAVPNGTKGQYYEEDMSFRLPKSTTPVAANDPDVPAGLTIDEITINGLSNVPPGLSWEISQSNFNPADETDGCIRFCGIPFSSGLYEVEVNITARIAFISQEVTFSVLMEVDPSVSSNDGFTLINNTGCGEAEVYFQNNISSNGNSGYTYSWDFGNGTTSTDENPSSRVYSSPGIYEVQYEAIIDTVGFILTSILLEEVKCTDLIGAPDIFVRISDPNGDEVYLSEEFTNTDAPLTVTLNLPLGDGNYQLEAIDADSGLEFGDDDCGTTSFNKFSAGLIEGDGYKFNMSILHPVDTIRAVDEVIIYDIPTAPGIQASADLSFCEGESISLTSSYQDGNQWLLDGVAIDGEMNADLLVSVAGDYSVVYTDQNGCTSVSDVQTITVFGLPPTPVIEYTGEAAFCENGFLLLNSPFDNGNQWFLNSFPITDATMQELMVESPGIYSLMYINANNCSSSSAELEVEELMLPPLPVFTNDQNLLSAENDITLSDDQALQWYQDGQLLDGENDLSYCATSSGEYTLEISDMITGCTNTYSLDVVHDASFDCTVGTEEQLAAIGLQLSPNPTSGWTELRLEARQAETVRLSLMDMAGKELLSSNLYLQSGSNVEAIDLSDLPSGMYILQVQDGVQRYSEKVLKQ